MNKEAPEIEIIDLSPISECRFILNAGDSVNIEVTDGVAFCYGWKLPHNQKLTFRDQSFPISTNHGCRIKLRGTYVTYYSAPFEDYLDPNNQYPFINEILQAVKDDLSYTVFVVGAPSSGKTSLCKWLCNTILSTQTHCPIYVNADPDQAPFCPPGCIGAIPVTTPINNFGFPYTDPIAYMYGATKVEEKRAPLFIDQLKELLTHISERRNFVGNADGGTIIDFPSVTSNCIYEMLQKAIVSDEGSVPSYLGPVRIIVIGNDKLYTNLHRSMPGVKIDKMPKLSGIENLSKDARAVIRSNEIRRYFYGDGNPDLLPRTYILKKEQFVTKNASKLNIYSFGFWSVLDESIMPIQSEMPNPKVVQIVPFGDRLIGQILAILPQDNVSSLWKNTVIGFMHVIGQGEDENELQVLLPNPDDIPSNNIIVGQVMWNQ